MRRAHPGAAGEIDERTSLRLGSLALSLVNGLVLQTLLDPERAPSGHDLAAALRALAPLGTAEKD